MLGSIILAVVVVVATLIATHDKPEREPRRPLYMAHAEGGTFIGDDPAEVLDAAFAVARGRVVVIETLTEGAPE